MATTTKMTYDDLDCLLDDDGNRYEIVDGEVVVSPRPLLIHQWVSANWRGESLVVCEGASWGAFSLHRRRSFSDRMMCSSQTFFTSRMRRCHLRANVVIEGPPDLCIEIASPSTRKRDRTTKYDRYAHFGMPEYRIVNPVMHTVETFTRENGVYTPLGVAHQDGRVHFARVLLATSC